MGRTGKGRLYEEAVGHKLFICAVNYDIALWEAREAGFGKGDFIYIRPEAECLNVRGYRNIRIHLVGPRLSLSPVALAELQLRGIELVEGI